MQTELKPLYLQVKEMLIQRIIGGEWKVGDRLPSEMRLATEYGVHQGTVRKALDELAATNLVERKQGRGTFVASAVRRHSPFQFFRMRKTTKVGDERPATQVLSVERTAANAAERLQLNMQASWSEVVRVRRLRTFEGHPAISERMSYPGEVFPGLDEVLLKLRPETTYSLLEEKYRVLIVRVVENLTSIAAKDEVAALLEVAEGTPLLAIDRIAYTVEGTPVEWRVSHCRSDSYEYHVELG